MELGRQQKQFLDILRRAKADDPTGLGWFSKMDFYSKVIPAITQPGARRDELIRKGYVIYSKKIIPENNWHYYRLVSEPTEPIVWPEPEIDYQKDQLALELSK